MPFFCNEDLSLHYVERGQGEPLVLIHGLGCCGAAWAFQVAALEKRFADQHHRIFSGRRGRARDGGTTPRERAAAWTHQ